MGRGACRGSLRGRVGWGTQGPEGFESDENLKGLGQGWGLEDMLVSFRWEKVLVARCAEMAEEVVGIVSGSGGWL